MSLTGYVVRRLLQAMPVALGVTILVFFLIHLVPGDPARTILGNQATPQRVALLQARLGAGPAAAGAVREVHGATRPRDLGVSLFYGVSAGRLVVERLPVTLWLIVFGACSRC